MFNDEKFAKAIDDLASKVKNIEELLFVDNYFYGCPCCSGPAKIIRSDAIKFETVETSLICFVRGITDRYTTKESALAHESKLKEFAKAVKEFRKKDAYKYK